MSQDTGFRMIGSIGEKPLPEKTLIGLCQIPGYSVRPLQAELARSLGAHSAYGTTTPDKTVPVTLTALGQDGFQALPHGQYHLRRGLQNQHPCLLARS